MDTNPSPFALFAPPYRDVTPLAGGRDAFRVARASPGSAVVWRVLGTVCRDQMRMVAQRPGGVSLILILPPPERFTDPPALVHAVERTRPAGILPHHPDLSARDLGQVLRTPPADLAAEVTDYLAWRGIGIDRDTRHLLRRTVELAGEVTSISALARAVYLSRRALGRRFMSRGLPVPSHWLHFARLLRVVIRLQNTDESVFTVGYRYGYPDGFSLSNQMMRLVGCRPSDVRRWLGWEWFMESWLLREAETGGLSLHRQEVLDAGPPATVPHPTSSGEVRAERVARTEPAQGKRKVG